jgi:hypothetical protein
VTGRGEAEKWDKTGRGEEGRLGEVLVETIGLGTCFSEQFAALVLIM